MRPPWARPGELGFLRVLLFKRQVTGFDKVRRSLVAQIRGEKKRLIAEGVPRFEIDALCSQVGVRRCSGCGRVMGARLEIRG